MKLWVDDYRDAPDDTWTEVRKVEPAVKFVAMFWDKITYISLDHDIENRPDDETFMPVAYFVALKWKLESERRYHETMQGAPVVEWYTPKIVIHTDNPVGAKSMVELLKDYGYFWATWEPFTSHEEFKTKYGL